MLTEMDSKGSCGNELTKFVGPTNKRAAAAIATADRSSNLISGEGKSEGNLRDEAKRKHEDEKRDEKLSTNSANQGKENQKKDEQRLCHKCNKSLSKARHLINIAGQSHRWHPECFQCNVCHQQMDRENTCYIYKDKIVCRDDYLKLQRDNSIKCSRCLWPIGSSDWVRRAGDFVYHLACFSCDICLRQMSTGEQFTVNIQERNVVRLLCRLHFAIEPQRGPSTTTNRVMDTTNRSDCTTHTPPGSFEFAYRPHQSSPVAAAAAAAGAKLSQDQQQQYLHLLASTSQQSTLLLQNKKQLEVMTSDDELNLDDEDEDERDPPGSLGCPQQHTSGLGGPPLSSASSSSNGSSSSALGQVSGGLPSKSKRVRTTFTEDQLSILQTHFQVDSNPDGQDLERIATITGLSKRVTQVWFQNSRARQKKYMIKRKPSASSSSATIISTLVPKTISLTVAGGHSSHQFGSGGSGQNQHHYHHHQHQDQQQQHARPLHVGSGTEESESVGSFYQQQKWSNMSSASAAMDEIDDQASRLSSNGSGSSINSGTSPEGGGVGGGGQLIVCEDNSNDE